MRRPETRRSTARRLGAVVVALQAAIVSLGLVAAAHAGDGLPLGDGKTSDAPRRGYVLACGRGFPGGGGAHRVGEWIRDGVWFPDEKPHVDGAVAWPSASIAITREGDRRIVRANGLPRHASGEFPIRPGTAAFAYDRNPNAIRERAVLLDLPADPQPAAAAGCVPMGMIGIATSGVAIYDAFDAGGRDAPAYEIQDRCDGHPERSGQYHYHAWSPCLADSTAGADGHGALAGYMLDGFPIFGPRGEGGRPLTNADLDECHGHTHAVTIDGVRRRRYHYHFTREYPYTIGCFRGRVDPALLRRGPPPGGAGRGPAP